MSIYQRIEVFESFYEQTISRIAQSLGLKEMEYKVLSFLSEYPQYDTATDIVKAMHCAKSHVSVSIRALQDKGLLSAEFRNSNHKTVHLEVTESGMKLFRISMPMFDDYLNQINKGFTQDELKLLESFHERMYLNSAEGLKNMGHVSNKG